MAPPTATDTVTATMPETKAQQSTQAAAAETAGVKMQMPAMPKFESKMEEREYLKGRLAAAFRIFGKYGYDEGIYICLHHLHNSKIDTHPAQAWPATSPFVTRWTQQPSG